MIYIVHGRTPAIHSRASFWTIECTESSLVVAVNFPGYLWASSLGLWLGLWLGLGCF